MSDDFEQGSMAAANAIIVFLRANGHGAAANDVLQAWEDGTITGDPVTIEPTHQVRETPTSPAPSRQSVQQQGYTGDQCDHCSSMRMKRTGHCMTCEDCGTTTGCS